MDRLNPKEDIDLSFSDQPEDQADFEGEQGFENDDENIEGD